MKIENIKKENDPPTFEKLFEKDLFIFKLMGLSSMNGILSGRKLIRKWWEDIPIIIGIMVMILMLSCEIQTMCQIVNEQRDYAIQLFSVICSGALCIAKSIRLWTNNAELYDLLNNLRIMWESARLKNLITQKISEAVNRSKKITKYYTIVVSCLGISYSIRPYMLYVDYQLQQDMNISFDFSQIVFPVNTPITIDSFVKYFICVTYQQCVCFIVMVYWISCDTLFAQLTTHVSLQFTILANELKIAINNCNLEDNHSIMQEIKNIIKTHQQLFIFCQSIETFFNPLIFFAFISNALNLCCCIYYLDQEIMAGNWDEAIKNVAHLMTLTIQTIIFCSYAHILTDSSAKIGDTVYHSQWMDCNQKLKTTLIIILTRAQKEFTCTAYGLITLNHKQMTNITNAAVSYFMLLKSL